MPSSSVLRILPTQSIPAWRTPSRRSAIGSWPDHNEDAEWTPERVAAFDNWLADRPDAIRRCWYHRQGFDTAMELAVRAMRAAGEAPSGPDPSQIAATAAKSGATAKDVWMAELLVREPITWLGTTTYLTDGQHRMCALRAAGLSEVLVAVR